MTINCIYLLYFNIRYNKKHNFKIIKINLNCNQNNTYKTIYN